MKTLAIFIAAIFISFTANSQTASIPDATVKNLDGNTVSINEITDTNKATVIVFWKSTDQKCRENLESLQTIWEDSLEHSGTKLISICVDCNGSWSHVKPFVKGKAYDFETYVDVNGNLKRAMNVGTVPCTIVFGKNKQQICRYDNYCAGYEALLCEKLSGEMVAETEK